MSLDLAWRMYRAGALDKADDTCQRELKAAPRDATGWFLLSLIANGKAQTERAIDALQQVLKLQPDNAEAHNNLGNLLARGGQFAEAEQSFRKALEVKPDYPEARNNLGNVLRDQGKLDEAISLYLHALEVSPDYADAHNNLGIAYARMKKFEEATASYRKAIEIRPLYPEAQNNWGIVLAMQGMRDEAIEHFEAALRMKPGYADAYCNLAIAKSDQNKIDEAIASYHQALKLQPSHFRALNNLGNLLLRQGKDEEAIYRYREAIRHAPREPEAYRNLGGALYERGEVPEAIDIWQQALRLRSSDPRIHINLAKALSHERHFSEALLHFDRALRGAPHDPDAHLSLALTYLITGDFERGWAEYEWRWKCKEFNPRGFTQPQWDGTPLEGRRILLHAEQGFGDTFQFLRYTKLVKELGGTVIVWCPRQLVRIVQTCPDVDLVTIEGEALPPFDVHLPLLSLPKVLGTTLSNIPSTGAYLSPEADIVEHWGRTLEYLRAFRVGICWQGNPSYPADRQRSIPLAHFAPLAATPNVCLISLQKGAGTEQLRDVGFGVVDFGNHFDSAAAFIDTAAVMKHLDLVITSDTAIAHLAGALQVPVWVALPHSADWRWLLDREDSPWYPTMRLFRQAQAGDWQELFERMATSLCEAVQTRSRGGTPQLAKPATADELNARGIALADQRRLDEAIALFRQARELNPNGAHVHNNLGNALRNVGRIEEAVECLTEALRIDPGYADAHNNLGIALARQRKLPDAIEHFERAIALRPELASAHNNLGISLLDLREPQRAIEALQTALRLQPDFPNALNNLGNAHAEMQQFDQAIAAYHKALELAPDYPDAHSNLGNALREIGKFDEAIACFERAIQLRPQYADAFNNLGIALSRQEQYEAAIEKYEMAIRLRPDFTAAHNNAGIAYANLRRPEKAIASYRQALRLKPDYAEAYNNLAIVLTQQGQFDEALVNYRLALQHRSEYPEAHSNLGIALAESGRTDEALEAYDRALAQRENYPDAHMNRALTLLLRGDFENGWKEYEWRWRCKDFNPRNFDQPRWEGEPLAGRRILLHTEQGFGDTFQFVRYARLVKERGGTVIVRCPRPLLRIVATCPDVAEVCAEGEPDPQFDTHLPLLSLPCVFGSTLDTIPQHVPYLTPAPHLVDHWRAELGYIRALRVGINWQGNPKYRGDHRRSIPLAHFGALAKVPGVRLVSLQKGFGTEQLPEVRFSVTDLGQQVDTTAGAFMDTAAILANLDLLVTSDTALAHLAGALGTTVWLALPVAPDWRWLSAREDSPWYPRMRLFRQPKLDDWESVFERMAADLAAIVEQRAALEPHVVPATVLELVERVVNLRLEREHADDTVHGEDELGALVELRRTDCSMRELKQLEVELERLQRSVRDLDQQVRCALSRDESPARALLQDLYAKRDQANAMRQRIAALG